MHNGCGDGVNMGPIIQAMTQPLQLEPPTTSCQKLPFATCLPACLGRGLETSGPDVVYCLVGLSGPASDNSCTFRKFCDLKEVIYSTLDTLPYVVTSCIPSNRRYCAVISRDDSLHSSLHTIVSFLQVQNDISWHVFLWGEL